MSFLPEPRALTQLDETTRRIIINYIRAVADKMGLRDWQFELDDKPVEDGKIAQTEVWGSSKTATIWLGSAFWKYGPRLQRETIVHELTHWHSDAFYMLARKMVKSLGREAYDIATDSLHAQQELMVDAISAAWAREMPYLSDPEFDVPIYSGHEQQSHPDALTADRD